MPQNRSSWFRKRHHGHPVRAFWELHPNLPRSIYLLILVGVVVYFSAERLLH